MPFKIFHLWSIAPVPHADTCLLLAKAFGTEKAKIKIELLNAFKYQPFDQIIILTDDFILS